MKKITIFFSTRKVVIKAFGSILDVLHSSFNNTFSHIRNECDASVSKSDKLVYIKYHRLLKPEMFPIPFYNINHNIYQVDEPLTGG